jgi:hypothetical protein
MQLSMSFFGGGGGNQAGSQSSNRPTNWNLVFCFLKRLFYTKKQGEKVNKECTNGKR